MKLSDFFKQNLVTANLDVKSSDDFFSEVSKVALKNEFVTDEFEVNVKKREENFPTGIQLEGYGIAIPHTDAEYVREEFISVTTFKKPIEFSSMEDANAKVEVSIAFLLGLRKAENQLEVLQQLMSIFQDKEVIEKLTSAENNQKLYEVLMTI